MWDGITVMSREPAAGSAFIEDGRLTPFAVLHTVATVPVRLLAGMAPLMALVLRRGCLRRRWRLFPWRRGGFPFS